MKIFDKIKSLFVLLKESEMTAVAAICAVAAIGIGYLNVTEYKTLSKITAANKKKLNEQKSWFNREKDINIHFRELIDIIMNSGKIDQPKLMNLATSAAKKFNIKYSTEIPTTEKGQFFAFNKLTIKLNDIYFEDLLNYDAEIERADSNICIDDIEISMRGNKLSAKIGLYALELASDNDIDIDTLVAQIFNNSNISNQLLQWGGVSGLHE